MAQLAVTDRGRDRVVAGRDSGVAFVGDRVKYRTIVADPPWDVLGGPRWASNGRSQPLDYPVMNVDDIAALPVRRMADDASHLYLWTINCYIEEAYDIARAWGFKPSTLLTWCKKPHGLGLGGAYVLTTEHVLFARRGTWTHGATSV